MGSITTSKIRIKEILEAVSKEVVDLPRNQNIVGHMEKMVTAKTEPNVNIYINAHTVMSQSITKILVPTRMVTSNNKDRKLTAGS